MLYYYIHTGHRVGLDRLRRSAPVVAALQAMGVPVTLLTNDFRAGEYAKEHFDIQKYVSVDVVRNIANLATPADALVFDSEEESRTMWEEMADYFETFIRISDAADDFITKESGLISSVKEGEGIVRADIVAPRYFERFDHRGGLVYFWGDDDYEMVLARKASAFEGLKIALLEGYYFFVQYGDELEGKFVDVIDNERYDEALMGASRFLTSSFQSALEALAAGSQPIYIPKTPIDRVQREKLESYAIPYTESFTTGEISRKLSETAVYNEKPLRKEAANAIAAYIQDKLR